ncbi:hypothetical protein GH740_04935 [Microbacterium sp. SYP-A9085]|jgi:hypothetical protein|uniref:hypothetical protein n=1 Tax=Microbacterium sp. SYP-A9085 TaxID=2664454 RepID=UPI00129AD382|nr:hypothetical protein [Microbacterium sp. SYP-A9085]MRH28660.1 hypothetical protein [Microbacterium sp. SYP-A9085]
MHLAIAAAAVLADVTSTPSPSPTGPAAELVTPGPWGFVAVALIALAVVLLLWDMMRRIRRGRYRAQVREDLDAQAAEDAAGDDHPRG